MKEDRFLSVWDAIEDTPPEAAAMRARAGIMIAIQQAVEEWQLPRAEAARRLGVTQPRLNDLLQGRVHRFDLEDLLNLTMSAGLEIEWRIKPQAA